MQDPQEIFNNLNQKKKEKKEINDSLKSALANSLEYQKIDEEVKSIKLKQKEIKSSILSDFQKDLERLEDINADIASDKIMLVDIAISSYVNGKSINLEDEHGNKYEPEFAVNFKKV